MLADPSIVPTACQRRPGAVQSETIKRATAHGR